MQEPQCLQRMTSVDVIPHLIPRGVLPDMVEDEDGNEWFVDCSIQYSGHNEERLELGNVSNLYYNVDPMVYKSSQAEEERPDKDFFVCRLPVINRFMCRRVKMKRILLTPKLGDRRRRFGSVLKRKFYFDDFDPYDVAVHERRRNDGREQVAKPLFPYVVDDLATLRVRSKGMKYRTFNKFCVGVSQMSSLIFCFDQLEIDMKKNLYSRFGGDLIMPGQSFNSRLFYSRNYQASCSALNWREQPLFPPIPHFFLSLDRFFFYFGDLIQLPRMDKLEITYSFQFMRDMESAKFQLRVYHCARQSLHLTTCFPLNRKEALYFQWIFGVPKRGLPYTRVFTRHN